MLLSQNIVSEEIKVLSLGNVILGRDFGAIFWDNILGKYFGTIFWDDIS